MTAVNDKGGIFRTFIQVDFIVEVYVLINGTINIVYGEVSAQHHDQW